MIKYGVDMVYPPTVQQAQRMVAAGFTVCGVYVGGPRATAHDAWHQIDGSRYPVRDLASVFTEFLPITVGRNVPWDTQADFLSRGIADGDKANSDTGACGFNASTPICMDLESGTYQKYPRAVKIYCAAVVSRLNGAGHPVYLYSDFQTIQALGTPDLFDGTWVAWWEQDALNLLNPTVASLPRQYDPQEPPATDIWQFGGGTLAGVSVDLDSFTDTIRLAKYG